MVLSTGTATIKKYGLNSTNIGQVTAEIKADDISPVLFYAYTVNEYSDVYGFINHYKKENNQKQNYDTPLTRVLSRMVEMSNY